MNFDNQVLRVCQKLRGEYYLTDHKETVRGVLAGALLYKALSPSELPAVGDYCEVSSSSDDHRGKSVVITKVLPRKSQIARQSAHQKTEVQILAANVDIAFIVTSANQDFNINRLHRFVLVAKNGRVTPVIILSKIDLIADHLSKLALLKQEFGDIKIISCSAANKNNLESIKDILSAGVTGVFIGSSGVGKSSLTNCLLDSQVQAVGGIRSDDDKGRHTTSSQTMFLLDSQGLIIDTPGIREIGLTKTDPTVDHQDDPIDLIAKGCRFSDCSHKIEPGCAIKRALDCGDISKSQLTRHDDTAQELALLQIKQSAARTKKRKA